MDYTEQFQTHPTICEYMAKMIPTGSKMILEPTPGLGNLVNAINKQHSDSMIIAPPNFFDLKLEFYDAIVMNPPFSSKYAFGVPSEFNKKGMAFAYELMKICMDSTNHCIALMPWFTISDSDVRMKNIRNYGLKSITPLSRKAFNYARIQTVVIEMERGFTGQTLFLEPPKL